MGYCVCSYVAKKIVHCNDFLTLVVYPSSYGLQDFPYHSTDLSAALVSQYTYAINCPFDIMLNTRMKTIHIHLT